MEVTQSQLATKIKEAISSPLLDLFGGLLTARPIQIIACQKFEEELSNAIAIAITTAVNESVTEAQ